VALPPDSEQNRAKQLAERQAAEQEVLLREVDEAVRQDQLGSMIQRYRWPAGIAIVLALAALGGGLAWRDYSESKLEEKSERLIAVFDDLEAGKVEQADGELKALAESTTATGISARLTRAAIALRDNRRDEGVKLFEDIAADTGAPQAYRDLATVRAVAANFEKMDPQQVIDRLKPLATPGNPWFGSAGEMVAMAYLKQGKENLAGPLFVAVAKDEDVPQTLRSRTRQIAGLLGYDAVVDVDKTLEQMRQESQAGDAAQGAAQ
jgi:hypothetical protein